MSNPLVKSYIAVVGCCILFQSSPGFAEADNAPSAELLEFLGEWVATDGQWIDPLDLLEMDQSELTRESVAKTSHQTDSSDKAQSE